MRNIFVLFFLFVSLYLPAQKDCELRKSDDDIYIYACRVEDSNLRSIRATFSLPTNLSTLAGYILDIDKYTEWQFNMIKAVVVERISENELIYHAEIKAPWPVTNRDLVVRLKVSQDPVSKVMQSHIVSIPDYIPPVKGVVRIPRSEGRWIMTPVGKDQVDIQYNFMVDPGGTIPAWLINLTVAEGPYKSFSGLTNRVKNGIPVKRASFIRD
jgi:hypothetical protein